MRSYRKPHRFKKKKSIFKNRFFWLTLLIFSAVIGLACFLVFSDFFLIKEIEVSGNKEVSAEHAKEEVREELADRGRLIPPDNIFFVSRSRIKDGLLSLFPQIADVTIERKWPDALKLTIIERQEKALFCSDKKGGEGEFYENCFLMDQGGIIFKKSEGVSPLPKIKQESFPEENINLGNQVIDAGLLTKILDVYGKITGTLDIKTREILFISEEMVNFRTAEGWDIYVSLTKDLDWQVTKLKAVLENYLPQEKRKNLEYIELRFGNLAPFKEKETGE